MTYPELATTFNSRRKYLKQLSLNRLALMTLKTDRLKKVIFLVSNSKAA